MNRVVGLSLRLLPFLLAGMVLAGCTPGVTRSDMDDNTGTLGESRSPSEGAGDIYVKLAIAYMQSGQMDIALQQAKKALIVEPKSADANNVIALIYDRLGEYPVAEYHFKAGLEIDPRNSYIHNAYGTFLCQRGRYDEADTQFQAALKNPLYRTPEIAYTNAAICVMRKGDLQRSETLLRQALQFNPTYPNALVEMAKLNLEVKQYLSAKDYLERYARVGPHTAESLWVGIQIARKLGDRNMEASYQLQLNSNFPDSREAQLARESERQ